MRDHRRDLPRGRGEGRRLRRHPAGELDRRHGQSQPRPAAQFAAADLRRSRARDPSSSADEERHDRRRRGRRGQARLRASAGARAMRRTGSTAIIRRSSACRWRATALAAQMAAADATVAAIAGDLAIERYGLHRGGDVHPGPRAQHDALRRDRADRDACRRGVTRRRSSSRSRTRPAPCTMRSSRWRATACLDDALRVAAGAHRRLGLPLLHRRRRPRIANAGVAAALRRTEGAAPASSRCSARTRSPDANRAGRAPELSRLLPRVPP